MKKFDLFSKVRLSALLSIASISFGTSFAGWFQPETVPDAWLSLARLLGGGAIGIISIFAITRLVQAVKNQPLDGQRVTNTLLMVIQKLDTTVTLMNSTTLGDHERMLKHDEDFLKRIEKLTLIENQALSNHDAIIGKQNDIIKQLDRMERKDN